MALTNLPADGWFAVSVRRSGKPMPSCTIGAHCEVSPVQRTRSAQVEQRSRNVWSRRAVGGLEEAQTFASFLWRPRHRRKRARQARSPFSSGSPRPRRGAFLSFLPASPRCLCCQSRLTDVLPQTQLLIGVIWRAGTSSRCPAVRTEQGARGCCRSIATPLPTTSSMRSRFRPRRRWRSPRTRIPPQTKRATITIMLGDL